MSTHNHASQPPLHKIEIIEHTWITMSDGVRLSAKIWLPVNAQQQPLPAILEFIPYRKRDAYAIRDHRNHAWLAKRGYACIRPDMRGHGDSEGLMEDEYSPREQQDTLEVIEWLSQQPWCNGHVGMMGLSWGGIASMQAAISQPHPLKAIIPIGASVDRYYDDGAYLIGGYPGQGLGWGGFMFGLCTRPPDPLIVGENWRHIWKQRLENTPMFAQKWLSHPLRDDSWIQGSVCEHYDKIKIPVLGISGWNDCWPNTMIRLLHNIHAPCRAVSGAWGHVFPNLGGPGPKIGFLQLALDWWDYWLKGIDNSVMDAPSFLAFIQDSHTPDPHPNDRPGRWIGIKNWPSSSITPQRFSLAPKKLLTETYEKNTKLSLRSPLHLGLKSGEYMPIAGVAELPQDQRTEDALSLCFDGEPLSQPLEILGTTYLHLRLESDKPCGLIAARLCDVAPNGTSTLISYGILNLAQRQGRETIAPITPEEIMDVTVRLNDTGWSLKPKHTLRLALSTQLWPMAWPLPSNPTLHIHLAHSYLEIPRLQKSTTINNPFGPPLAADPPPHTLLETPHGSRHLNHNIQTDEYNYDVHYNSGLTLFEDNRLQYGAQNRQTYTITEGNPLSASISYQAEFRFARDKWNVSTQSHLKITCDTSHFILNANILALEDNTPLYTRKWNIKIPRTLF